jgi:type III pantothenate kinase
VLLAIDVGNSNITLGLYDGERQLESWRLQTVHDRTADEYGLAIRQLLEFGRFDAGAIDGVIIASVVPALTTIMERLARRSLGLEPLVVGPGLKTGMPIRYDPPKDVGADRIVNGVAAYARCGTACIVVDFGTATTFDSISARGEYMGGAIAPGIRISMDALFHRAAKLPKVEIARPKQVVGRSTVESMQSGIFFGYVAMVDGLVRRMKAEMGPEPVAVLATGGLAAALAAESETIESVDENLTLEGLRLIYQRNRPGDR